MPMLVSKIDAIARREGRDVLYICFYRWPKAFKKSPTLPVDPHQVDWQSYPLRREVMSWLKSQKITYELCYPILDPGWIQFPYLGDLYVHVPNDPSDPTYIKLVEHFEFNDGAPRIDAVLIIVPLATAITCAEDEDIDDS